MNSFLIDSDIVIWYLKGRKEEINLLENLLKKGNLYISVVTITEVRVGLTKEGTKIIAKLKEVFQPIALTEEMAELAGELKQKYNLGIADMFMAATAVISDYILVTHNKKHFPMPQVRLYS